MSRQRGDPRKTAATSIGAAIDAYVQRHGLKRRLDQASVIPEWPELVGQRIAAVTEPLVVLDGGILVVAVRSAAWMQELQLHSRDILRRLGERHKKIRRIVWRAAG